MALISLRGACEVTGKIKKSPQVRIFVVIDALYGVGKILIQNLQIIRIDCNCFKEAVYCTLPEYSDLKQKFLIFSRMWEFLVKRNHHSFRTLSSGIKLAGFSLSFCFPCREQPIFSTRAHVFQIDPNTKKNWVPTSKHAVTVSYFYDSTRNVYRITSLDGSKVSSIYFK